MGIQGVVGDQLSYNFQIVKKDGSTESVRIVAWVIDDGQSSPVTFPNVGKGERLQYDTANGWKDI